MKSILILFLFIGTFSFGQNEVVYEFGNVQFMERAPNLGLKRVKRMAFTINAYMSSIMNKNYDDWYNSFSDSTIARVNPPKFKNKFKRMQEYGVHYDSIKVISIKELQKPYANETGMEYELVLDFGHDLNVANRVSFDKLKRTDDNTNARYLSINVISINKDFEICIHKYGNNK